MNKMTVKNIHDFGFGLTVLFLLLFGTFLIYMYVTFNPLLTGNVRTLTDSSLLVKLNQTAYDRATQRLQTRAALPPHDPQARNPFSSDSSAGLNISQ